MQNILSRRVDEDVSSDEDSDDEELHDAPDQEKNSKLLQALNKAFKPATSDTEGLALSTELKQNISNVATATSKIDLRDLLPTMNEDDEKADLVALKENLTSLDKIAREKERGQVFQAMESTAVELEERRMAFDFMEEQMEKWNPIVEYIESARVLPLNQEERIFRKERVPLQNRKVKPVDEFDYKLEQKLAQQRQDTIVEDQEFVNHDDPVLTKEKVGCEHTLTHAAR